MSVLWPTYATPATIYLDESEYKDALLAHGFTLLQEDFEDDVTWSGTRAARPQSVISEGITWASNHPANGVRTGTLGGSVADGSYGFFSLPHGNDADSGLYCDEAEDPIPSECWLNDGWTITASPGKMLYGVGGWFDSNTGGGAKITFLLDDVDVNGNTTDNIGNWNRDGERIGGWTFVGVLDTSGFASAEILELSGKDFQQEYIFGDKFSIGTAPAPAIPGDFDGDSQLNCTDINALTAAVASGNELATFDLNADGVLSPADVDAWLSAAGEVNLGPGMEYPLGDATLDGIVDRQDFWEWQNHKFSFAVGWCSGNFNVDSVVDGQDFHIWHDSYRKEPGVLDVVPEPTASVFTSALIILLGLAYGYRLRPPRSHPMSVWQSSP